MDFDYFYKEQSDQYAFYRIPKALIVEAYFQDMSTDAKLLYEALHYSEYDRLKNNERHRIAETMRTMKDWEDAGLQRFAKYGNQRAWKRVGASRENGFTPVPEQMELPFAENC